MRKNIVFFGVIMAMTLPGVAAIAADVRPGTFQTATNNTGRAGSLATGFAAPTRMPTMPTMPGGPGIGTNPGGGTGGGTGVGGGTNPPVVTPDPEASIDECMQSVLTCVSGGALPNGINDLFNSDLRNAIVNGMNLCATQVDNCIATVRRDGKQVYFSQADVWIDFNSRVVQPEYYSFVLRRTGLTPNQAENTCWLLDKNTYGSSFAAVSNTGVVTSEYANNVGAYNQANSNMESKDLPQGVQTNKNNPGVDGQRGHYARWDATTAECLVRVAAYNKDTHITNKWLFGALGDDRSAEVWKAAGSSFTCNKDLFGFGLMNQTSTVAVVGVGGGAVVGAGTGALIGAGQSQDFDCENRGDREALFKELRTRNITETVNLYLPRSANISITDDPRDRNFQGKCEAFVELYAIYGRAQEIQAPSTSDKDTKLFANLQKNPDALMCSSGDGDCQTFAKFQEQVQVLDDIFGNMDILKGRRVKTGRGAIIGGTVGAAAGGLATAITAFVEKNNISCNVGDGLDKISMNRSGRIDTLKEYYVKWNLALPDTIRPTAQVVDCNSWKNACGTIKDISQCANAQVNYKPISTGKVTLVDGACMVSGNVCIENYTVAVSHGACK